MARQRPVDQVETLKAKQKALMEQLRQAQAKARIEEAQIRRKRNEIAGAVAMQELEANSDSPFSAAFRELLNVGVTTAGKRALFGLPAVGSGPAPEGRSVMTKAVLPALPEAGGDDAADADQG